MAYLKCLQCGEILESKSVHNLVRCSCENKTFLDGGGEYCRYGGVDLKKIQIIEDDTDMSRRSRMDEKLDDDGEILGDDLIEKLDKTLRDYR